MILCIWTAGRGTGMDAWVEHELAGGTFPDQRLKTRLGRLLGDLGERIGGTLPMACQDWAATKAAYRFCDNPRIDDGVILAGHVAATAARFAAVPGTVLVLHDTTEFSFTRNTPDGVGYLSYVKGRHATHTACGLLLHSSLVVTTDGRPLGLAAVKFWSRKAFKNTNARKRTINPTTVPIEQKESARWLENVTRSTQELGDPGRASMSATGRGATSSSCSVRLGTKRTSWSARPWIGWPAGAARRSPR